MTVSLDRKIIYPESDGKPMADNTKQFRWIVLIKENLECLFAQNEQVFVAGDLLWYPRENHPEIKAAPDILVVFDRPKGDRSSYLQWEENQIAPQVVFEILSPGNTVKEMTKKLEFYNRHGVEEYYIYDPENNDLSGFQRRELSLAIIDEINDWTSPRLGIRLVLTSETLEIYYPNGQPFLTTVELKREAEREKQRAETEKQRAELEKLRADTEKQRADEAELEINRLRQLLKQSGIDLNIK
jgi:Uma2 family endonuclease